MNLDLLLRNSIIENQNSLQKQNKKQVIKALEHTSLLLYSKNIDSTMINNWLLQIADFYNHTDTSTRYFIYKFIAKHKQLICKNALNNTEILKRFSFILNSGVDQSKIFTMLILGALDELFTQNDLYIYHYILNIFVHFCKYSKLPKTNNYQGGRRSVIMGLAINRCLKNVLQHLYISNMEDTIERSLYDYTTNKEDILSLVVFNQNFKDYVSIRDILMKTVSYALDTSDYIYFARCMSCTLVVIKKFQLLKDTLIQMI